MNESRYVCTFTQCGKQFKRSDHLLRHKRSHEKSELFPCSWKGCERSFVRRDVCIKHYKRHIIRENKKTTSRMIPVDDPHKPLESIPNTVPDTIPETIATFDSNPSTPVVDFKQSSTSTSDLSWDYQQSPKPQYPQYFDPATSEVTSNEDDEQYKKLKKSNINYVMNPSSNFIEELIPNTNISFDSDKTEMNNLIKWLLDNHQDDSNTYLNYSPTSSFKALLADIPDFTFSTSQCTMSDETRIKLIELIPSLQNHEFLTLERIEQYLDKYWTIYHIQFPVIHRPTFSTETANPLLLLSMITLGSSLMSQNFTDISIRLGMINLSETIAKPLRWLICSHSEIFEVSTSWVLQSLLILECFEITCTSRKFHRRAHLHHGFNIQLLRRSPLLGGTQEKWDDLNQDVSDSAWESWIELESLKRCAYATFLMDVYHAIIFGHKSVLQTHHIKLSLPCPDSTWEGTFSADIDVHEQVDNRKFLASVTDVLTQKTLNSDPFTNRILLAGIISLAFQTEQNVMQTISSNGQNLTSWKKDLLIALDYWFDKSLNGDCCSLEGSFYIPLEASESSLASTPGLGCKFPVFHIAHAFLRFSQYDCIIYAGAPKRMNVKTNPRDYSRVTERVKQWANSVDGRITAAHAYVIIYETLLGFDEQGNEICFGYDPSSDPEFYRANIIASALFIIWDYNYCIFGKESSYLTNNKIVLSSVYFPESINGYKYISNIKHQFTEEAKLSRVNGSECFRIFANTIVNIKDLHHIVGLLRLFKDRYVNSKSQLFREYGRLMENCIQRSLGRSEIICSGMYEMG